MTHTAAKRTRALPSPARRERPIAPGRLRARITRAAELVAWMLLGFAQLSAGIGGFAFPGAIPGTYEPSG